MPNDDSNLNESPVQLICHPATPAPAVRTIEIQVTLRTDGALVIDYRLWGDMARVLVPQHRPTEQADLLWEHTCFEAFIGTPVDNAYREFNFSPSGQWAAYAFSDYRQRVGDFKPASAPQIATRLFLGRLELQAILAPEALPDRGTALQIGLSAVIEGTDLIDGSHSYWALHHPTERPDFHHRAGFTLRLTNPRNLA